MVHTIDIKVRGYHLDVFGHVNNARYLEFLEEGRWSAFEQKLDFQTWALKGYAFTVVNINIDYRSPAKLNDLLCIETSLVKVNRRSGVIHQAVKLKKTDALVAEADVTFVLFDPRQQKTAVLEGEILQLLQSV